LRDLLFAPESSIEKLEARVDIVVIIGRKIFTVCFELRFPFHFFILVWLAAVLGVAVERFHEQTELLEVDGQYVEDKLGLLSELLALNETKWMFVPLYADEATLFR
jgi:hypothetical protein